MKRLSIVKRKWCSAQSGVANFFARRSVYRFYLHDLVNCDEASVASALLGTEYFRRSVKADLVDLDPQVTYLVVAPHQDDESIGAGGTLLKLASAGAELHVLFMTNGRQATLPVSSDESIRLRRREAECACNKLNAEVHELGIDNVAFDVTPDHVESLRSLICRLRPRVIFTPWLLDYPPKHRACNQMLAWALEPGPSVVNEVWGYQVHNSLVPNVVVEITGFEQSKRDLIGSYQSQLQYDRPYDHYAMGMAAWNARFLPNARPGYPAFAEIFSVFPSAEFARLTNRFYRSFRDVYCGSARVQHAMENLASARCKKSIVPLAFNN